MEQDKPLFFLLQVLLLESLKRNWVAAKVEGVDVGNIHKSVPQQLRQLIRAQVQQGQMGAKHWVKVGCLQCLHEVPEELQRGNCMRHWENIGECTVADVQVASERQQRQG
jgi:hypothetical protein